MPAGERSATWAVGGLVPIVSASLWLVGFWRTVQWIEKTAQIAPGPARPEAMVMREGTTALARVRRYTPWTGRCLARALSLWWILRRGGVDASLNLGVRRLRGRIEAHAWVIHNGRVLADSQSVAQQYQGQFESLPGTLSFRPRAGQRD